MPDHSLGSGQNLPTGTVTFLFTDIEASTHLLQQLGDSYAGVLDDQRRLLRIAFQENHGHEVDTQGDAFFVSFARAKDAVHAAISAQRALASHPWPQGTPLRVRMGLHTGEPVRTEEGYVGMDVHRSARICSAGHGGQILLSQATHVLVENDLPEGASLRDLGEHRLKDLQHPEHVFQLVTSDLPVDFPSLKSLDALPNNLPRQLTSFIGRKREITEAKRLLSSTYLLTLSGSGGCGKTRLALQVAADLADEFPDGVWVAELASLSDPDLVTQEAASSLGVREVPGSRLIDTLSNYLKSKGLLLILDNCEHLMQACTTLSDTLLRSCPNLKIIISSREALGIAGETIYRVPSLSFPDPKSTPTLKNLRMYESVRLFTDRAVAVQPTFRLTDDNASAVAHVCHRLDGIPLALELAAVRVKVLEVEEITSRLDDRFRLLTGGSRTALPRQQTLRATIEWSYNLLAEEERVLLGRLAVFMGGWSLEAAETICIGKMVEDYQVLDLLTNLVDKSLVTAEGSGGKKRYHLLETVRQYARERLLESGEVESLRNRHLQWYLDLAELAEKELWGRDELEWQERLDLEYDNLRAALEWSLGGEKVETGLRMAAALGLFWTMHGNYSEGIEWLEGAPSKNSLVPSSPEAMSARANALWWAGWLFYLKSEDYEQAITLFEESLSLFRELGDKRGTGRSLFGLGIVALFQNDYTVAAELLEESLVLFREKGNKSDISFSIHHLGILSRYQGEYKRAEALLEENLTLSRERESKVGISVALLDLGHVRCDQGDYDRAQELGEESLSLSREIGDKRVISLVLRLLGLVALGQGDHDRATELFGESLALAGELGVKLNIAQGLEGFAAVAVAQRGWEKGVRLLGAAEAVREAIGSSLPPSEQIEVGRYVEAVQNELGEKAFAEIWEQGRAMSTEEAVEDAMRVSPITSK